MLLAEVAVPVPLTHPLTYSVPEKFREKIVPGSRVLVPLARRRIIGVVLSLSEGEPAKNVRPGVLKNIVQPLDEALPSVPEDLLAFLLELSQYYLAPPGEVMRLALPPVEKKTTREIEQPTLFSKPRGIGERTQQYVAPVEEIRMHPPLKGQATEILAHLHQAGAQTLAALERRWKNARSVSMKLAKLGLVWIERRASPETPVFADIAERDVPPELLPAQTEAAHAITSAIGDESSHTFLLHGVTGSGKTEVYLRAIASARAKKRGSIMLVPEIALTPQLVGRFRARFGDDVAVLHSALTPKERSVMWHRLRKGEVDVAIGARSALFAPIARLGLVIVDEEHDSSFKQEDGVRYHARDMAILRAHRSRAVIVLGSATPSIESVRLVELGRAVRLRLPNRARAHALPDVEVVDLRRIGPGPTGDPRISIPLHRALDETVKKGEQAILFLNRRGFSPSVRCGSCGKITRCPHCSVSLTFHKRAGQRMRCHYCEYDAPLATRCPHCGAAALVLEGLGTERLEDTLVEAFPGARVARLDRDVGSGKRGQKILERMRDGQIDILVGTQMVTKGHDLPMVTLVGIINADAALSMPDFRAAERAFQLMVQVAGRAGRAERKGKVLIQTYDPDHPAVVFASRHDVDGFLERELADRKDVNYPPFSRAALLRVEAVEERAAAAAAHTLAEAVRASGENVTVTGPAPAPIARLRNRYRFRAMVRSADRAALRRALLHAVRAQRDLPYKVRAAIDIDPVQLL